MTQNNPMAPAPQVPMVWVRPNRDDAKVVLFERNEAHPGGEAYVAASEGLGGLIEKTPVQVARTGAVMAALAALQIVEVPEEEAKNFLLARHMRIEHERAALAATALERLPDSKEFERRLRALEEARNAEQDQHRRLVSAVTEGIRTAEQEGYVRHDRIGARTARQGIDNGEYGPAHEDAEAASEEALEVVDTPPSHLRRERTAVAGSSIAQTTTPLPEVTQGLGGPDAQRDAVRAGGTTSAEEAEAYTPTERQRLGRTGARTQQRGTTATEQAPHEVGAPPQDTPKD